MKTKLNPKRCGLISLLLLVMLLSIDGCATTPQHDPLEGWKDLGSAFVIGCPFEPKLKHDYERFIEDLPSDERLSVRDTRIRFYETKDGRRAVRITTFGAGFIGEITWDRILIYDTGNKRIKTIKHKVGRFLS